MMSFLNELQQLLNKYSKEQLSNTPDFILAEYLNGCLDAWNKALLQRSLWNSAECDKFVEGTNPCPTVAPMTDLEPQTISVSSATQEPVNVPPIPVSGPIPAPLENPRQTNSFDLFAGTSWAGKKQW